MHFPVEVHHLIISYLDTEDLQCYRLVNRQLARIGASKLFNTVKFHASLESTDRIISLSDHETLRNDVCALIWDTNLWGLELGEYDDATYFSAWMTYLEDNRWGPASDRSALDYDTILWKRPDIPNTEVPRLPELIIDCDTSTEAGRFLDMQHRAYRKREKEEAGVLKGTLSTDGVYHLLSKFERLSKVYIVNGDFKVEGSKILKKHFRCGPPNPPDVYSRGEGLHERFHSKYPINEEKAAGTKAFRDILLCSGPTLRKLRGDAVHYYAFERNFLGCIFQVPLRYYEDITSLHLVITTYDQREYKPTWYRSSKGLQPNETLQRFLQSLTKLQSLKLSLERFDFRNGASMRLSYVFPPEHTWAFLRKLSLSYFETEEHHLKKLLERHSSTLEDLRLRHVCLGVPSKGHPYPRSFYQSSIANTIMKIEPNTCTWPDFFRATQPKLNLRKAKCEGKLLQTNETRKVAWTWNLDTGLGRELAAYLVHGGVCPLTANDAIEVDVDAYLYQWGNSPFLEELRPEVIRLREEYARDHPS